MKPDRIVFGLLTAGSVFLATLAQSDTINAKTTVFILAGAQAVSGLLRVLWPNGAGGAAQ